MTAAIYRTSTPSLSVPQTQNTAPVLEFNCLYTHDVRRKQKRWQDGFLRFHTFNKRVMVYDIPRNFIGDTHWKAEEALQDGDEVTLEKGGVLVQVAENVGTTETDLTELHKSAKKGASDTGSSSPVRGHAQTPQASIGSGRMQRTGTQLKHRSLNALLGTPKGKLGKAVLPTKSPFEVRHANIENEQWDDGRPAKRLRTEEPAARETTRKEKTTKLAGLKGQPQCAPKTIATSKKHKSGTEQCLGTKDVIELSGDDVAEPEKFLPGFSSDVLAPSSSPAKPSPHPKAMAKAKQPVRSSSPAFQTQKNPPVQHSRERKSKTQEPTLIPRAVPSEQVPNFGEVCLDTETTEQPGALKSPIDASKEPCVALRAQHQNHHSEHHKPLPRPSSSRAGQPLRMTSSSFKKKTLLCQDQLTKKPKRIYSANTEGALGNLLEATSPNIAPDEPVAPDQPVVGSQRRQLEERLARISKKHAKATTKKRQRPDSGESSTTMSDETPDLAQSHQRPHTPLQDSAAELARLDQMIMPHESDKLTHSPPPPGPRPPKSDRSFRRVVSEATRPSAQKRSPGAPIRYTPSPTKKAARQIPLKSTKEAEPEPPAVQKMAPPPKPRMKKPMQRSVSLNVASNGISTVILSKPFHAPGTSASAKVAEPEKPPDPWSKEAFDLFAWRPPGWDEETWCVRKEGAASAE